MSISERWQHFEQLPPEIHKQIKTLPDLFRSMGVRLAYLFGSLAQTDSGQDVDLALLTDDRPAHELREVISQWLGTERLDIVDLQLASPVLRMEIVETGRPLFEADDDVRLAFELQTLREYRDTAHLRQQQEAILRSRVSE